MIMTNILILCVYHNFEQKWQRQMSYNYQQLK